MGQQEPSTQSGLPGREQGCARQAILSHLLPWLPHLPGDLFCNSQNTLQLNYLVLPGIESGCQPGKSLLHLLCLRILISLFIITVALTAGSLRKYG